MLSIFGKRDAKVTPAPEETAENTTDIQKERSPPGKLGIVGEALSSAVSSVGGHAIKAGAGMKHAGEHIAEEAYDKAGKVVVIGKDAAKDIVGKGGSVAEFAYEGAGSLAKLSKDRMQDSIARLRKVLEGFVKRKVQAVIIRAVDKGPRIAKYILEDPEMPGCVARAQDRLIDSIWPDIREEILWEVAVAMDGKQPQLADPTASGTCCLTAFFRYHLFPYDKGFWGKLLDPVNMLLRFISLIPVYGISPLFFLFVFLVIDKSDEYQLIDFILSFKGTQFITMGIIRCIYGFTLFLFCVTAEAEDNHTCEDNGPGTRGALIASSAGLLLVVFLTWIAFLLLPCSEERGRSQLQGLKHLHTGVAHIKGGYISYFLWFDLAFFLVALIPPIIVLFTRKSDDLDHDDWVLAQAVFAGTVIYGLLSAPFFIFTLPGLQRVLTHAMPTGYDREGRCRKFIRPAKPKDRKPEEEDLVTEEDSVSIFTQMREIVGWG